MPPQLQALLQQRNVQIGIGAVVLLIIIFIVFQIVGGGGGGKGGHGSKPLSDKQLTLATVDSAGKAIEIQALLARHGLQVDRMDADNKIAVMLQKGATEADRDEAVIAMVQSGLMDKNVGLEAFDKGDLTASREEKKIKLIRAQQGELARLIRKIPPIEDASVSLSIPEQTLFTSHQKPMSASVQVTVPSGTRLDRDKVRSIINLMTGSIQSLDSQHVALTDTNGNTYNSVLDVGTELNDKLEEQDNYMKQKVASQLDKLVGPGHYVVTVSTLLREAPKETLTQSFDPDRAVVVSKQSFNENLNAKSRQDSTAGGPASSFIPNSLTAAAGGGGSNKDYDRSGTEVTYDNTKVQSVETRLPGMIEDISIAVTIDRSHYPGSIPLDQLQTLLARAASPKVDPTNVSIANVDFNQPTPLNSNLASHSVEESGNGMAWLPWAVGSVIVCLLAIILLTVFKSKPGPDLEMQIAQQEIQQLKDLANKQQSQLQAAQQQTQQILEQQKKQLELTQQSQPALVASTAQTEQLKQTLSELKEVVRKNDLDDEDLDLQIRSWIEST